MAGQALSLKGCFLARLRTHTCGHKPQFSQAVGERTFNGILDPKRRRRVVLRADLASRTHNSSPTPIFLLCVIDYVEGRACPEPLQL